MKAAEFLAITFSWLLVAAHSFQIVGTNHGVDSVLLPPTSLSKQRSQTLHMSDEIDQEQLPKEQVSSGRSKSELKKALLQMGASYDRGFGASASAKTRVDNIIRELEAKNRETNAAIGILGDEESPLSGAWRMIWTSATDVLSLGASPVAAVGAIYQIFEPPVVTNVIDFIPRIQALLPPSLVPDTLVRAQVKTRASPRKESPNRVGLVFEAVKLQPVQVLGRDVSSFPSLGTNLPKIPGADAESGPGYFDTTYLDDEILIIRQNAAGGLFVLVKVDDFEP